MIRGTASRRTERRRAEEESAGSYSRRRCVQDRGRAPLARPHTEFPVFARVGHASAYDCVSIRPELSREMSCPSRTVARSSRCGNSRTPKRNRATLKNAM